MLVSNSHIDNQMQMKLTAIINAIQDIEGIHIENLGEFSNYVNEHSLGIFLTYRQIDILEKPKFNTLVNIKTYPYNTNSIGGWRQIYLTDELERITVKSVAFGAFVNLSTGFPERIPKAAIKSINNFKEDVTMEVLPRKINIDNYTFENVKEVIVEDSYIDRYNHLNNAYYVEFALNTLTDVNKYNRIRVEYSKSFVKGDIIVLAQSSELNNEIIVTLSNKDNEIYAIVSFSKVKLT